MNAVFLDLLGRGNAVQYCAPSPPPPGPPPPPPVLSTGTDQSSPPAGATAKVVATPPSDARAPWRIKQDETQESVNHRKRAAAAAADLEAAKGKPSESSA